MSQRSVIILTKGKPPKKHFLDSGVDFLLPRKTVHVSVCVCVCVCVYRICVLVPDEAPVILAVKPSTTTSVLVQWQVLFHLLHPSPPPPPAPRPLPRATIH